MNEKDVELLLVIVNDPDYIVLFNEQNGGVELVFDMNTERMRTRSYEFNPKSSTVRREEFEVYKKISW